MKKLNIYKLYNVLDFKGWLDYIEIIDNKNIIYNVELAKNWENKEVLLHTLPKFIKSLENAFSINCNIKGI